MPQLPLDNILIKGFDCADSSVIIKYPNGSTVQRLSDIGGHALIWARIVRGDFGRVWKHSRVWKHKYKWKT